MTREPMLTWVRNVTGAASTDRGETIQTLWSGYGEIVRVHLEGTESMTVVVKRVSPPRAKGRSHKRKLRSYSVEAAWYRDWATRCNERCRVPVCHGVEARDGGWLFALEDLDAAGFPQRRGRLSHDDVDLCLSWLAAFHATFMSERPEGLWKEGTYWHLGTRPDELDAMRRGPLRDAAHALDRALRTCSYRTLVHGDAKVANFCFAPHGSVAAVDFQYVGGGCGMKDVAYLLSCLGSRSCEKHAASYVDGYFASLRSALAGSAHDVDALETEWRALLPLAWADFERFMAGWAPSHAGRDAYAREMTRVALDAL